VDDVCGTKRPVSRSVCERDRTKPALPVVLDVHVVTFDRNTCLAVQVSMSYPGAFHLFTAPADNAA
jgi:hypothetical protein